MTANKNELLGLHVNTQVMSVVNSLSPIIKFKEITLEAVGSFTYLGSQITADDYTGNEIKTRHGKAHGVFSKINRVLRNMKLSVRPKLRLYKSNALSVV